MEESKLEKDYSKSVKDLANRAEMIIRNCPYFDWSGEVQGGAVDDDLIVDLLIELASRNGKDREEALKSALVSSEYITSSIKRLCNYEENEKNGVNAKLRDEYPSFFEAFDKLQ